MSIRQSTINDLMLTVSVWPLRLPWPLVYLTASISGHVLIFNNLVRVQIHVRDRLHWSSSVIAPFMKSSDTRINIISRIGARKLTAA